MALWYGLCAAGLEIVSPPCPATPANILFQSWPALPVWRRSSSLQSGRATGLGSEKWHEDLVGALRSCPFCWGPLGGHGKEP